ncbi:MAG: hypothetical protein KDB63_22465 [Nocardioidaceae bacterium]|nr:hypothetical protein [Nocardioidaceae bacterium]
MTTATRDRGLTDAAPSPVGPQLVAPPKLRRRPALMAAAAAATCLGALLAAWAWTSATHTEEVLAARTTIGRGEVITAADIERVRINGDPALHPVPATQYDDVVGQRAAFDIAAGGLLTTGSTTTQALPPRGQSVVGIALTPAQLPALPLRAGDRVRIVATPGEGGNPPSGVPDSTAAEVVDSRVDEVSGDTVVDVLVPYADAAVLAARAATGSVVLVLDSGDR